MTEDEYLENRLKTLNFEYEATLNRRFIDPEDKKYNLLRLQGRVEEVEHMKRLLIIEKADLNAKED